jgi:hypothetical protein
LLSFMPEIIFSDVFIKFFEFSRLNMALTVRLFL